MKKSALLVLLGAAQLAPSVFAQQRQLEYVLPRGGALGATVDVLLNGQYMQEPKEIRFYDSCIQATDVAPGTRPGFEVKAKFHISADCAPGEHVFRLRTSKALTEPLTFWVSRYATVFENEKKTGENDTIAKAMPVPLNSTVEGQMQPGNEADVDIYKVEVPEGKRLSVEVEAIRLGTTPREGENDLMVRILDAEGKELGVNKDSALFIQDPVLSIAVPKAGTYYVEIKQQIFIAPRLAYYRAHIGTFARPLAVYPAGGPVGEAVEMKVLGDPLGVRTETVSLPKKAGDFQWFAGTGVERAPSPNLLRVAPYRNVLKSEADVTEAGALPVALNGILDRQGKADVFKVVAKKDQQFKVRVYARALGSPMDAKIWIRPANSEKHLLDADDSRLPDLGMPSMRGSWVVKESLDPVALFKVPADGEYLIGIEDGRGTASPLHVYRIEIEQPKDAYYTHITQNDGYMIPRLTGMIIPKGSRWVMDVQIAPGFGNNYKGDIELEAVGLPKGVHIEAPPFVKGALKMPVMFVADADAEPQSALVELLAHPVDRKFPLESGTRQGFALINRGNELPLHVVFLDKFMLAVTNPPPFDIELKAPAAPLAQNGELPLEVKVTRHGDFKGPVEIVPDWLPGNVTKGPVVTIPADKTEGTFVIHAGAKASAGKYRIAMSATTTEGDSFSGVGRIRVASPFVELSVAEPYVSISLKRTAVERGQTASIVATIEQKHSFSGQATLTLKNLPKGVELSGPAPKITSKDTEATFQVKASQDALAGLYKDLTCELAVMDGGQKVTQQSGSGVLRVDPARMAVKK